MFSVDDKRMTCLLLAGTYCLGLTGCGRGVPVYIDNSSAEDISVSINGEVPVDVPGGERRTVYCQPGKSVFVIRQNNRLSHMETHTIQETTAGGDDSAYLLNPDRSRCYVVMQAQYGQQQSSRVLNLALSSPDLSALQKRKLLYDEIARSVRPLPMTGWHNIAETDYRFESLPDHMLTLTDGDCICTLQHVTPKQYLELVAAIGKSCPTGQDCQRLQTAAAKIARHF